MNEQKPRDKVNEMAIAAMSAATRRHARIKSKPRTRDGHFSPTVFERYQRNEKAPHGFNVGNVCIRRFNS